jgi:hypothetical protein
VVAVDVTAWETLEHAQMDLELMVVAMEQVMVAPWGVLLLFSKVEMARITWVVVVVVQVRVLQIISPFTLKAALEVLE